MSYSSTLFKVKFQNENSFHLHGKESEELYKLFKDDQQLNQLFDERQLKDLTLFRQLEYTQEQNEKNLISIGLKSRQIGKTLTGNEYFEDQTLFNVLSKSIIKITARDWNSFSPEKIEDTKNYIMQKYPQHIDKVRNIKPTKYLYTNYFFDKKSKESKNNKFIYFPQFLKELSEHSDDKNREIQAFQTLKPNERFSILEREWKSKISPILKKHNIKLESFNDFNKIESPTFLLGNNRPWKKYKFDSLVDGIKQLGLFYNNRNMHNIVIVDATGNRKIYHSIIKDKFKKELANYIKSYKLDATIETTYFDYGFNINRHSIEARMGEKFIHYINNSYGFDNFMPIIIHSSQNNLSDLIYNAIKNTLHDKRMPSQFVSIETIQNSKKLENAFPNIILGLFSKFGNIPYVLQDTKKVVDFFVGYDVSRDKVNGNVRNYAGGTYFFNPQGTFHKFFDFYPDGEKLREHEVKKVFPPDFLRGKRIIIHRDGDKHINEVEALMNYFKVYDIKAHIVYITKSSIARIFKKSETGTRENPEKGIWFQYSENKVMMVTSDSKIGTKQPLKIEYLVLNDDMRFEIKDIVKQINDLSYLYYGSIGDTNLPITTYSSHKISKMMKHGISFENIKIENIYFWI